MPIKILWKKRRLFSKINQVIVISGNLHRKLEKFLKLKELLTDIKSEKKHRAVPGQTGL